VPICGGSARGLLFFLLREHHPDQLVLRLLLEEGAVVVIDAVVSRPFSFFVFYSRHGDEADRFLRTSSGCRPLY
jgi:hypothetical protein